MQIKVLILCFKKTFTTNKPITTRFTQYVSFSQDVDLDLFFYVAQHDFSGQSLS